jgi:hypothetical protein
MTPPESPESRSVQRRKAIQRGEPRPEFTESPAERLRAFIRSVLIGGCRMPSQGDACECPLCDVDRLSAEVTRFTQQREEAEKAMEFARDGWSEVGARACPLCVYEAGVFKRRCNIHEYADALQARAEAAEAALHSATRAALLQAAEDVRGLSNWIRTHGNINSDDAIDECARAVANVASQLTTRAKESGA